MCRKLMTSRYLSGKSSIACPTNAIYEPYRVDATKCISYHTIELKEQIPEQYHDSLGEWMYGCDICQDVCPWNNDASYTQMNDFTPPDKLLEAFALLTPFLPKGCLWQKAYLRCNEEPRRMKSKTKSWFCKAPF